MEAKLTIDKQKLQTFLTKLFAYVHTYVTYVAGKMYGSPIKLK